MLLKSFAFFALVFITFLLFASEVDASFVFIDKDGRISVNVLASEDAVSLSVPGDKDITINKINEPGSDLEGKITLKNTEEGVSLNIKDTQQYDVTNIKENLVEIEQRGDEKKVLISLNQGSFELRQDDFSVLTKNSVYIDAKKNKISVETQTGEKYLYIFPYDAVQSVLRAKALKWVYKIPFELTENNNDLSYKMEGYKNYNMFNIFNYKVPITAYVSASTGEVINTTAPAWLYIFDILFG